VLIDEHDRIDGRLSLTVWQRGEKKFEQTAKAEFDHLLAVSRGGGKFVARIGPQVVVGDSRTLQPQSQGSKHLDDLLGAATGWDKHWVTEDGRYVVVDQTNDSREPLALVALDLVSGTSITHRFTPRDNWVQLSYVESVQGELRLVIGYGKQTQGFRESWTHEVVNLQAQMVRPLPVNHSLSEARWDWDGKRFFVPGGQMYSCTLKIVGEEGEPASVIPKLPAELSSLAPPLD
jgi:hypothetical protein